MTRLLALVWPALRAPDADQATFDAMLDRLDDLSPRIEAVDRGVALSTSRDSGRCSARSAGSRRGRWRWHAGSPRSPCRAGVGDNRWLAVLAARLARPQRRRRAGRLPRDPCPGRRRCPRPALPGPAPRRPGHARPIRPLRADQHGAAGHAPAIRGRRPVRPARRAAPGTRPRPGPTPPDPSPTPGAAERPRGLRAAGAGDHRDRPLPAPPRRRAVRRAARPPPGARPRAPRPCASRTPRHSPWSWRFPSRRSSRTGSRAS